MHYHKSQPTMEVFDSEFHNTFDVPTHLIVHIPPPRLNITRLVICRNYRPGEPSSCSMGDGCKFVHVDVEASSLQPHPIHVNYAYRSLEKCSYARLPAGETLTVMAPNERPPVDEVPSERVLVTRGSLMRKEHTGPLSHCAHYYFNRMCNRGERCNFIHSITVDPTVTSDFKRAPCCKRTSAGNGSGNTRVGSRRAINPSAAPFHPSSQQPHHILQQHPQLGGGMLMMHAGGAAPFVGHMHNQQPMYSHVHPQHNMAMAMQLPQQQQQYLYGAQPQQVVMMHPHYNAQQPTSPLTTTATVPPSAAAVPVANNTVSNAAATATTAAAAAAAGSGTAQLVLVNGALCVVLPDGTTMPIAVSSNQS